jgi:NitT/TauT family transport system ATP-binding protein
MRQRVSLCRALIADPSTLLMDEPFSALDAITRDDMNIVLLELWERYRKTVLFVTHSIREAVMLSDRVLVMGRSPSKIIAGIEVPFARPRDFAIGETSEFNELCGMYGIRSPGRVKAKPRPGIDHGRGSRTDRHSGSRVRAPF